MNKIATVILAIITPLLCLSTISYRSIALKQKEEIYILQEKVTLYHIEKLADIDQLNGDSYETVHDRIFPPNKVINVY